MRDDPLDSLFVKGDEVNRELLSSILSQFVRLDEKGRIFPLASFYSQSNKNKILLLLLSKKALNLKSGLDEPITPSALAKLSDIPEGSLRPTLRLLVDERLVDDENSRYLVFSHALPRCAELFSQKKDSGNENENLPSRRQSQTRISMRGIIEDILRQGGLDEGKSVREIFELVQRRRPGTVYNPLYKVVLDLVHQQVLAREIKDGNWLYYKVRK
ncbi:MAG: hypothetical protein V1787_06500 [Candidatus Micrarchaeota archaeon]